MKYRREIDGLRAVAVLPVILFHAGLPAFSGGYVGVDIFFVISGYLITSIIIADADAGRFSLLRFYERRARRILPALFFVMLCCIPAAWFLMLPSQLKDFSQSLLAVSLFVSNVLFWRESGYFEAASEEKPLLHTWSLAVEEQFYLFFPLLLLGLWRFGRDPIFYCVLVLSVLSLLLSEWSWRNAPSANFYLATTRAWELLAGSIAAFVTHRRGVRNNNLLSGLGLIALLFALFVYDQSTPFPSLYAAVPVIGVVLLILFSGKEALTTVVLGNKIFVGIGLISYSAYLWHQPLFAFARLSLLEHPSISLMICLSCLSLGIGWLSWRFVESPFRGAETVIKSRVSVFALSLLGIGAFVVIGWTGHKNNGFENRFERLLEGDVTHRLFHEYVAERYVDCTPSDIAERALVSEGFLRCKQTRPGDPDWVLLGDSHAEHLFLGLAEANPARNIVFYIEDGAPYLGDDRYRAIFDALSDADQPKTVFLTMHYVSRVKSQSGFASNFAKVVRYLKAAGHQVILLGDIPRYDIHPEDCIYGRSFAQIQKYCTLPIDDFLAQKAVYDTVLRTLSETEETEYLELHMPFCDATFCTNNLNGTILYRDNNHLNIPGSRLVANHIMTLLTEKNLIQDP